jgi:hypothetical protein
MSRREFTPEELRKKFGHLPDIGTPICGTYRTKLVRGGPWVAAKIVYGYDEYETMAYVGYRNGIICHVDLLWPWCHKNTITQEEYDALIEQFKKPDALDPTKPIDLNALPPIKF